MINLIGLALIALLLLITLIVISAKLGRLVEIAEESSKQTQTMQAQVVAQLRKVDAGTANVQQEFVRSNKMLYDLYVIFHKGKSEPPPEV